MTNIPHGRIITMSDITVPARSHSHGAAKPKKGSQGKNGPISYIQVNEKVWQAIKDVAQLRMAGRDFRTIEIHSVGKVEISNWGGT
jgi:hypothetical protein